MRSVSGDGCGADRASLQHSERPCPGCPSAVGLIVPSGSSRGHGAALAHSTRLSCRKDLSTDVHFFSQKSENRHCQSAWNWWLLCVEVMLFHCRKLLIIITEYMKFSSFSHLLCWAPIFTVEKQETNNIRITCNTH